jgi:ubiquinone biosynthesis protein
MTHPWTTQATTYKRLRRFQHIVSVLAKHGFGEALTRVRVWERVKIERHILRRERDFSETTAPQRLRLAFEELGPTFIKLGQILSTRPDLVSPAIILELKKLQTSAHLIPANITRGIIESELGRPISELFDSFDDTPLAAASLAQVHRAVLKGKHVVLKVQRPDIIEITKLDIDIMHNLAALAERYSSRLYLVNPTGIAEEFASQIKKELDFRMEANNQRLFARNFAGDGTIHIPDVYPKLCTKRVITMEYLDGINISDTQRLIDEGYNLRQIAKRGAIIGFKAAFQHGFFHADPHPGNVFVLPGNVIGLIDFGMMATLSLRDRERLARLVFFISTRDEKRVARALNEIMEVENAIQAEEIEPSMSAIIKDYGGLPTRELPFAAMLFAMMQVIMKKGARLRPQLLWLTKSIALQEDIAHSLNADFNVIDLGRPYARQFLTQKLSPIRQPFELYYWLVDVLDLAKDLPYNANVILREFRKGRLKIEFQHVGLEPVRQTMSQVSNRLSLTIIIAALLVSASVIVLAEVPPLVGNIPLLALIGYIIAGILSFMLALSIRSRKP